MGWKQQVLQLIFQSLLWQQLFCANSQETNFCNFQQSRDGFMEDVPKYNKRRTPFKRLKSVTVSEIKQIIAIILYMGIFKLPNWWMYWGSRTAVPIISESMTRNRFEDNVSILHFNENKKVIVEGQDTHNKLLKILPLTDHFKTVFSNIVIPETYQAINDMMVLWTQNACAKEVCQVRVPDMESCRHFRLRLWFRSLRGKRCKCPASLISFVKAKV